MYNRIFLLDKYEIYIFNFKSWKYSNSLKGGQPL